MIKSTRKTTLVTLALSIAAAGAACDAQPLTADGGAQSDSPRPVEIAAADGTRHALVLMPGTRWDDDGGRLYLVRSPDGGQLQVSRVMGPDNSAYLEVRAAERVLGAAELGTDSITLRAEDGRWLRSACGMLPPAEAQGMVEPLALALLDEQTLQLFDRALFGDTAGEGTVAAVAQPLTLHRGIRVGVGEGCGTTCQTPDGTQKCCCKVGDRCVSGATFCKCEVANIARF